MPAGLTCVVGRIAGGNARRRVTQVRGDGRWRPRTASAGCETRRIDLDIGATGVRFSSDTAGMRLASSDGVHHCDDNPTFGTGASARVRRRDRHGGGAPAAAHGRPGARLLVWLLLAASPASLRAAGGSEAPASTQSLEAIARKAEATMRAALPSPAGPAAASPVTRVAARTPDPRLRLAPCDGELGGALPGGVAGSRGRGIVQVSCPGPVRWSVLVPVTVETEIDALVTRRSLPRGVVPAAEDLEPRRLVLAGSADSYVTNLDQVSGFQLARPLASGSPLTREVLAAGPVVRRGESVTLVTMLGGLQVRAPGLALQDARPGERVRAQNVNSLKVVEGRADKQGMIEVDW